MTDGGSDKRAIVALVAAFVILGALPVMVQVGATRARRAQITKLENRSGE